jgi:hypothetical protein
MSSQGQNIKQWHANVKLVMNKFGVNRRQATEYIRLHDIGSRKLTARSSLPPFGEQPDESPSNTVVSTDEVRQILNDVKAMRQIGDVNYIRSLCELSDQMEKLN